MQDLLFFHLLSEVKIVSIVKNKITTIKYKCK